jgi:hypothetical protein
MRENQPSARSITSLMMTKSLNISKITSTTRKQLKKQQVSLLYFDYELELHQKLVKFIKKINAMTYRIELLKVKISVTKVVINARNICKDQSAKILQTKDILYIKEA